MSINPPNFDLLLELLGHTDHNLSYFAATKLVSII